MSLELQNSMEVESPAVEVREHTHTALDRLREEVRHSLQMAQLAGDWLAEHDII